ncbi:MAG: hypothetical protein AAGA15_02535 [Pseudomonadota bacterium]
MAEIQLGNLTLLTRPIQLLSDWPKVQKHAWRELGLGATVVGVWDCGRSDWVKEPDTHVELPIKLQAFAFSPLGRPLPTAKKGIQNRLLARSGLGSGLGPRLNSMFKTARVPVPRKDMEWHVDKNYRNVFYFYERRRHILCVPKGGSPRDDYLILSLPEDILWYVAQIGVCGIETKTPVEKTWFGPDFVYEFDRPGVYRAIDAPRARKLRLEKNGLRYHNRQPVPENQKSSKWRQILRGDAGMKRDLAARTGGKTVLGGSWSIKYTPDFALERAIKEREALRIFKKYS